MAPYPGVDPVLTTIAATEDDVRQLRDALRGTLGAGQETVQPAVATSWREGWPALAEIGLPALCVPEASGGFGLRVDAAVAAAAELGAALHGAPFAGLTASARALASNGDDPVAEELLSRLLSGELICAFGMLGDSAARLIDGADQADAFVLLDGDSGELVLLSDNAAWSVHASRAAFDVSRSYADVVVKPGAGHRLANAGEASALYRLLLSADAVGCVQHMLDRTVDYSRRRTAFGRAIGGFQAVQHRLVEHSVRARGMSLLIDEAARLLSAGSPEAGRSVARAEVSVSSGAAHILHDLLQLTGAIGFTWEYGLHFYERRAHHDARLAANPRAAIRTLSRLEGWSDGG